MAAGLDRVVLCRKAERIPSHRMDQIISLEHLVTAPHIRDYIASPVSHMQSVAGRIREHIQTVVFRLLAVIDIYRVFFPDLTPFLFGCLMIIRYCHGEFLLLSERGCPLISGTLYQF